MAAGRRAKQARASPEFGDGARPARVARDHSSASATGGMRWPATGLRGHQRLRRELASLRRSRRGSPHPTPVATGQRDAARCRRVAGAQPADQTSDRAASLHGSASPRSGSLAGGLFHRHYWVTLTFPLAVAAGVASPRSRRRWRSRSSCLAIIPSLVSSAHVIRLDRAEVAHRGATTIHDCVVDEAIGRWYDEHRTPDIDVVRDVCERRPRTRRRGRDPAIPVPVARRRAARSRRTADSWCRSFAGDHPPTFVAGYQSFFTCNPSGVVDDLLRQRYDHDCQRSMAPSSSAYASRSRRRPAFGSDACRQTGVIFGSGFDPDRRHAWH